MSYWGNYNKNLLTNTKNILKLNENSSFNYIEGRFYNHVRDLLAIILSASTTKNQQGCDLKILDFGSSPIVWSNLKNKIDTAHLDVTIFDPFLAANDYKTIDFEFKLRIVKSMDELLNRDFDISILGSVIQYMPNFLTDFEDMHYLHNDKIFISHTPLSLKGEIQSKQLNAPENLRGQTLHDYFELSKLFNKLGYCQSFKSTIDPSESDVNKKYLEHTVYANILFNQN
tara:strand:- start:2218 stop:2901 length:684 start_codon:yes stop_codon:yes gene_type:complete